MESHQELKDAIARPGLSSDKTFALSDIIIMDYNVIGLDPWFALIEKSSHLSTLHYGLSSVEEW